MANSGGSGTAEACLSFIIRHLPFVISRNYLGLCWSCPLTLRSYANCVKKHYAAYEHHQRGNERSAVEPGSIRQRSDYRRRDRVAESMDEENIHCHRRGPNPCRHASQDDRVQWTC